MKKGIDVSKWQGNIDWSQAGKAIDFAILNMDTSFERNYSGAVSNGVPVGTYKYSYAHSTSEAAQEAAEAIAAMKGKSITYPVFYDLEENSIAALGKTAIAKIAKTFLDAVAAEGYSVGIYSNPNWYDNYIDQSLKDKYDFWIASVPINDTGEMKENLRPSYGIAWQYSWKGSIPGITTDVDLDIFFGEVKMMSKIDRAVEWAVGIANNPDHGYDQAHRWGPDYDCSSLLISAWQEAGVPVKTGGATYTGNMKPVFTSNGFEDITSRINLSTGAGLRKGDVVLNIVNHTAMCISSETHNLVMASINEKGTVSGGKTGDQTGGEIKVRSYYNYPWDCVLRYTADGEQPEQDANVLVVDGSFGPATTRRSQQWAGTEVDGVISYQPSTNKKYLYSAYTGCWQFLDSGYDAGSSFIRALQIFLKNKGYYTGAVDGWCGKKTVTAWQKWLQAEGYYAGPIDGSMGPQHVKAWQRFLNEH